MTSRPVSPSRRKSQKGNEMLEFLLVAVLFLPMVLGTFVTGMELVRSIQVNHIVRDLADMYIHGADFSGYPMQTIAQRLATGMDLQIGPSFAGNNPSNTANGGRGVITVSQVTYIGDDADPNCQSVLPQNCTNANKFVFTQRIQFGSGAVATAHPSSFGNPSVAVSSTGSITQRNAILQSGAALPGASQVAMQDLWQSPGAGRTPLIDGQVFYAVEAYFESPDLVAGYLAGEGVYARWFF